MLNEEYKLAIVVSPEDPEGTALLLEPSSIPTTDKYQNELYQQGLPAIVLGVKDLNQEYNKLIARENSFTQHTHNIRIWIPSNIRQFLL